MLVNFTNPSTTTPVYVAQLTRSLAALETVSTTRTQAQIDQDNGLRAQIAAGLVTITFTAAAGDEVAGEAIGDGVMAEECVLHKVFTAGTAGSADDVVIYTANTPWAMQILDVTVIISTLIAASTATLRDTLAGGGVDLSGALATSATGRVGTVKTATNLLAKGSSLVLRRSDRGIAGEVVIRVLRMA